jgi:hypothetical protein
MKSLYFKEGDILIDFYSKSHEVFVFEGKRERLIRSNCICIANDRETQVFIEKFLKKGKKRCSFMEFKKAYADFYGAVRYKEPRVYGFIALDEEAYLKLREFSGHNSNPKEWLKNALNAVNELNKKIDDLKKNQSMIENQLINDKEKKILEAVKIFREFINE